MGTDWKRYRREVEWKCRWLELRVQDLQRQVGQYDVLEQRLLLQRSTKLARPLRFDAPPPAPEHTTTTRVCFQPSVQLNSSNVDDAYTSLHRSRVCTFKRCNGYCV